MFIVCNDTCRHGLNLLVNISSFYDGCDRTCLLDAGDHPFVRHLSYVFYAKAQISKAEQIQRGVDREILIPQPDMDEGVFTRVEAGVTASSDTPMNVVRYFQQL
ncbi:hypothetical protein [Mameliella alba]|uniref:hypothetical protein n=1 Tax=Mameliella alba TaxID=561184 RepID=UPI001ADA2890|nr:hypothetical protein [Mameliella alba]